MSLAHQPKLELMVEKAPIRLQTSIKPQNKNGQLYFVSQVLFFKNNQKISNLQDITQEEFSKIVSAYKEEIDLLENNDGLLLVEKGKKLGPFNYIKNAFQGLEIALNSLNVIMIDEKNNSIARTTIELDADILTVLRPDLNLQKMQRVMAIQGINVYFINKFFRLHILKFMKSVRWWILRFKYAIAGIGTFGTVADLKFVTLDYVKKELVDKVELWQWVTDPVIIYQIIIPVGTFLLFRYWKKMITPIIRRIIMHKLRDISKET